MAPAPWDGLSPEKTLFTLITGANSGIGFGIGQRLIDEFLASRPLDAHLVLIPTTRSAGKSLETVAALRRHARGKAETSEALRSRAGPGYDPRDTTRRIHVVSVQLDLCDLVTVKQAAEQLVHGTLGDASADTDGYFQPLVDVRIPRLDSVIFNAGIGGWSGLDWPLMAHNVFTKGLLQAFTYPTYKAGMAGLVVNPLRRLSGRSTAASANEKESTVTSAKTPLMGEVFCANVFGHYLFGHEILPLLSRPAASALPPGRLIWESSIEPAWENLSLSDFQAVRSSAAYESSKRLTDVLALTSDLPSVKPYSTPYLTTTTAAADSPPPPPTTTTPPKIYLAHPGVVVTALFPLNAFLFFWYRVAMHLARLLGSPWHTVDAHRGARAMVWLALAQQEDLDGRRAGRAKWGSCADRRGAVAERRTEVDGWGWEGRVESPADLAAQDAGAARVLRRLNGRRSEAVDLTEERLVEFEELGAACWREMERLRAEWGGQLEGV